MNEKFFSQEIFFLRINGNIFSVIKLFLGIAKRLKKYLTDLSQQNKRHLDRLRKCFI